MDVVEVSSQPYSISEEKYEIVDENEGIVASSQDEEASSSSTTTVGQTMSVGQILLKEVDDTQIGSRSVYHGSVAVNNIFEITANEQHLQPSTSIGTIPQLEALPAAIQEVSAAVAGTSLFSPTSSTSADIFRGYNEYLRSRYTDAHPSTSSNFIENDPHIEHQPLIKNNVRDPFNFRLKYIMLLITVSCLLLVSVVLIIVYGHRKKNDDNLPASFTHRYRDRTMWSALPPKHQISQFKYYPPKFVVVAHTATQYCYTPNDCSKAVRNIQASQMIRSFDDIAYNFLVAGDGLIYEGRGWNEINADTPGMGCSAMSVAFVGNFINVTPTQQQTDAFRLLLETAASTGRLMENYQMFMKNQIVLDSKSPGQALTNILEKWDHWQPFVKDDLLCSK